MVENRNNSFFQRSAAVAILATLCVLFWGSAASFIKVGYGAMKLDQTHIPSLLLFAGIRFCVTGSAIVLIFSLLEKRFLRPVNLLEWKRIGILMLFETFMQYVPYYIGLTRTSGTVAAVIHGCNGFTTILVAVILFRSEKMTLRKAIGCLFGICAVLMMNFSGLRQGVHMTFFGEGFLVLAQMGYVIGVNLTKVYGKDSDPIMLTGWQFIIGGLLLASVGYGSGGSLVLNNLPAVGVLSYLSIFGAITYAVWCILLKYNDVSRIAVYNFLTPLFGILCSVIMLKEMDQALRPETFGALVLTFLGIRISSGKRKDNI